MKLAVAFLITALWSPCPLWAQQGNETPPYKLVPPKFGVGLTISRHQYTWVDDRKKRRLTLDAFRPESVVIGDASLPIIVMYFGGGWINGRPGHFTPLAQALAHRGYVTVVPNYRLSLEAPFPSAIHDCKAAIRWSRKSARMLGGDPERIAVAGGSAGGHLAGFVAATNGIPEFEGIGGHHDYSSTVQAAIVMCGSMNFSSPRVEASIASSREENSLNTYIAFLGGTPAERPHMYRLASPLTHLSETMPPTLFIDGEFDDPKERYTDFWKKMDDLEIPREFVMMPKAPHPFWNYDAWFDDTVEAYDRFLRKFLREE